MLAMDELEILRRLALAAAVGLLFGIQRGWQLRDEKAGKRVAGIRTFTLIGLTGGVCGLLAQASDGLLLALGFFGFAIAFALMELRQMQQTGSLSATNLVAELLTFALGAYAILGSMIATGATAVLAALILAERQILHGFLRRVTWPELRAALLLLVMTVVLLPVLPDRTIDPLDSVNPYEVWLMTVMIAAVSFAGYVAMRLSRSGKGLLYAGLMGGLVTSTTVTWTFAGLARRHDSLTAEAAAAILGAWLVSLLRMCAIAIAVAGALAPALLPPIGAAAAALLLPMGWCLLRGGHSRRRALPLRNPFDLLEVLKLGALLAIILLASQAALNWFGEAGLSVLGAASGLLDVDPITLSMARMVRDGTAASYGASVIALAALANGVAKTALGFTVGGWRIGVILLAGLLAAAAAGGMVLFLLS
jgi:uncharacterized membrane protein (DUF4010 family)